MRITGGRARGIPIKAPKGESTRPATDRIREAIFSSLGSRVEGSRVVDLFAGTGSYGLEALSRGASHATFYEIDRKALACLKENRDMVLKCCQLSASVAPTITRDLYIKDNDGQRADYIFIDPPYDSIEANLRRIFARVEQLSKPDASVILEFPGELEPKVDGWRLIRRLGKSKSGSPSVAIFKR